MTIDAAFQLAIQHHTAGQLSEAEAVYRQILTQQPNHLGAVMNLSSILLAQSRLDEAIGALQHAVQIAPDVAQPRLSLADALQLHGDLAASAAAYREAIRFSPQSAEAHNNLGSALNRLGQLDAAVESYRLALRLNPQMPEAHRNLAEAMFDLGRFQESISEGRAAVRLRPDFHEAYNCLGIAQRALMMLDEAIAAYHAAARINPSVAEYPSNLAEVLLLKGQESEAAELCRRAIQLNPQLAEAHGNLGIAQKNLGQIDAALASFRTAIRLRPEGYAAYGGLIYLLQFYSGATMQSIAAEHDAWSRRFAQPLAAEIRPHENDRDPNRRLRIGYVSPDFRAHAECFFVLPLLEAHDHEQFEVHAYSSVRRPDEITARFKRCVDAWHDVLGRSDADLAEQIRADRIDILIDLTMHMMDNRLLVFRRKPAPLQVTWLAYPGSSGLRTIDYRLTDSYLDPPDSDQSWSAEKAIRLPDCWCAYQPVDGAPDVNGLPALQSDAITFGSLNNFCKFNSDVLSLWAELLLSLPRARLMMLAPAGNNREVLLRQFESQGVRKERVELIDGRPRADYLKEYHRIDIALDPFPYNGITTTCDALWMGVPVLTLPGQMPQSRAGMALMTTVGLSEFVASSREDFIRRGVELCKDIPKLAGIRSSLRERMRGSPLMDAPRFAKNVESAYRSIWRNWCATDS